MKEEEEEDLNDREVDDDEEGEFNSVWTKLDAHALIKTNLNNHQITQSFFFLMFISVSQPKI